MTWQIKIKILIILKLTAYKDGVLKDYAGIDVFTDPSFSVDNTFGKIDFGSFFSKYIYIVVLIVIVLILGAISSFLEPVKNVLFFIINLLKNILNFILSLILWPFKAIFIGDTSFWLW